METRVPVSGYEGLYEVSNLGRLYSLDRVVNLEQTVNGRTFRRDHTIKGRLKKPSINKKGYERVGLVKEGVHKKYLLHRIVYFSFQRKSILEFDPKGKTLVCHKDDNPLNNRLDNLFIGTNMDNMKDCISKGRARKCFGVDKPHAILDENMVRAIRQMKLDGMSDTKISKEIGVHHFTVRSVTSGRNWKHVE